MAATSGEGHWRLYPRLLLRRAGFDIGLLTGLTDPEVVGAAAGYRERAAAFERQREQCLAGLRAEVDAAARDGDRSLLRSLSKARSRIGRRGPLDGKLSTVNAAATAYERARREREDAWEVLRAALDAESADRPRRIRAVLDDDRVRDAVLQLAPSYAAEVERWSAGPQDRPANAKTRAFFRRTYLYCQRLGAKNETTSFFGPLIHGMVAADGEGITLGPETPSGITDTEAFLAFWAVGELARVMAEEPATAAGLPLTWIAACRREDGALVLPDGRRAGARGALGRVAALVDGTRTPRDIARDSGLDLAEVTAAVDRLRRAGAVHRHPEPPSTEPRPLDWLIALADERAATTAWPEALRDLRDRAGLYAGAVGPVKRRRALEDVEAAFAALTGSDPRREGGRMYADRLVVSLDSQGDQGPVTVGAATAARWERELAPVLDVAAHYGELLQSAASRLCADLMREAGTRTMPYDELIRRSRAAVREGRDRDHTGPADAFAAELTRTVAGAVRTPHGAPARAVLAPADLAELRSPCARPRFVSPDLMLETREGRPETLVLGELHPYVFAWGSQGLFDHDPAASRAAFSGRLDPWGGPERIATVIRRRRHKGLVAHWFPGRFVEITARATDDRARTLPVTDLTVELADGVPVLRAPDGELVLYAGEDDHVHLRAFAAPTAVLPPVVVDGVMPRWGVGDVVAQRARWWVDPARLLGDGPPSATGAYRTVQHLRSELALPRFVFAHLAGEPKPVGVDLDSPLAVETLTALVSASAADRVALTEMRPAPDRLWLRRQGRPVTSEFRLALRWETV
ncbi:hypothetical protein AB0K47_22490 [Streptomyces tirandamycinicus]|uniref:hypothetical protein n=1 Tax=Streptomyces tirandamycinicus TaxID=2174846 RepID=UPI00342E665A